MHTCSVTRLCPTLCNPMDCLSVGLSRQEYWSGLPFPPPGHLPNPGIKPMPPALAGRILTTEPPGSIVCAKNHYICMHSTLVCDLLLSSALGTISNFDGTVERTDFGV